MREALTRMLFLHGPRNTEEQKAEQEARTALVLADEVKVDGK